MSFKIKNICFIDTANFFPGISIEKLGEILDKSNAYHYVKEFMDTRYHSLLKRKLTFPYEWLDNIDKLQCSELPSASAFYTHLKTHQITEEEYKDTIRTFQELQCKTVLDYLRFYNLMDVLILADAMENFRHTVHQRFHLDPVNYISFPACAWKCALRKSKVTLEYLRDPDMLQMIERDIRGGMCGICSQYYAKVEDPSKESINYIDANNLYGFAMLQILPVDDFK